MRKKVNKNNVKFNGRKTIFCNFSLCRLSFWQVDDNAYIKEMM